MFDSWRRSAAKGKFSLGEEFSFDLSAAEWRRSLTDEAAFIKALAVRLEQALPGKTRVERTRPLFSKEAWVSSIEVAFDAAVYRLTFDKRHGVTAEKAKVVRGIRLKTDPMTFEEWLQALSAELCNLAARHQDAREAMERFLFS